MSERSAGQRKSTRKAESETNRHRVLPDTEDEDWVRELEDGDWVQEQLDVKRRAFNGKNLGALLDALIICCQNKQSLPQWLGLGLIDSFKQMLRETPAGRKWLHRYRQDLVDYMRFETMKECREHGLTWQAAYFKTRKLLEGTSAACSEHSVKKSYQRINRLLRDGQFSIHCLKSIKLAKPHKILPPRSAK